MTTWNNQSKNVSSFTNEDWTGQDLTFDEADFTWNEAQGTWDDPRTVFQTQSKNASSFTNQSKN